MENEMITNTPFQLTASNPASKGYAAQLRYKGTNTTAHTARVTIASNCYVLTLVTGSTSYVICEGSGGDVQADTIDAMIDAVNAYGRTTTGKGWAARRKDVYSGYDLTVSDCIAATGEAALSISGDWTDMFQFGTGGYEYSRLCNYDYGRPDACEGVMEELKGLIGLGKVKGAVSASGTETVNIMEDDGTVILTQDATSGAIDFTEFSIAAPLVIRGPIVIENQGDAAGLNILWKCWNP
jgi:hypothetical protein